MRNPDAERSPETTSGPDRCRPSVAVVALLAALALLPWLAAAWGVVPGGIGVLIEPAVPFGELLVVLAAANLLVVLALAALISAFRRARRGLRVLPRLMTAGSFAMLFALGLGLAWHNAGLRLGFDAARPKLERLAELGAEFGDELGGEFGGGLPSRAGLVTVFEVARDTRGGVFFKTGELPDMIDTVTYGYVKEPNPDGTPFGAADYRLVHLRDGWYAFAASNDYH
ncbi:MAG: hypothetical protein AAGF47_06610 [Planctomycetota bacterium]